MNFELSDIIQKRFY